MPEFLSDEWFDAAAAAVEGSSLDGTAVVAYAVEKGPSWTIRVADGSARLERGVADDATVTMTMSRETAAAVASRTTSAQAAFMRGDLKIGGNVRTLIDASPILDRLAEAFESLRTVTTF